MAKPKYYVDIGHGDVESFLWLYCDGKLDSRKTGSRTHEKIYGMSAMNYWRGRYEPGRHISSVQPPVNRLKQQPPQYLIDALEAEYGGDLEVWAFNPPRRI